jgi:NAD(P)H-nitrite reductase large subunit
MHAPSSRDCSACPPRMICHCLQVTEETLVQAIDTLGLTTLKEIRSCTGAGDGCNACHRRLLKYLERRSSVAVVSASGTGQ